MVVQTDNDHGSSSNSVLFKEGAAVPERLPVQHVVETVTSSDSDEEEEDQENVIPIHQAKTVADEEPPPKGWQEISPTSVTHVPGEEKDVIMDHNKEVVSAEKKTQDDYIAIDTKAPPTPKNNVAEGINAAAAKETTTGKGEIVKKNPFLALDEEKKANSEEDDDAASSAAMLLTTADSFPPPSPAGAATASEPSSSFDLPEAFKSLMFEQRRPPPALSTLKEDEEVADDKDGADDGFVADAFAKAKGQQPMTHEEAYDFFRRQGLLRENDVGSPVSSSSIIIDIEELAGKVVTTTTYTPFDDIIVAEQASADNETETKDTPKEEALSPLSDKPKEEEQMGEISNETPSEDKSSEGDGDKHRADNFFAKLMLFNRKASKNKDAGPKPRPAQNKTKSMSQLNKKPPLLAIKTGSARGETFQHDVQSLAESASVASAPVATGSALQSPGSVRMELQELQRQSLVSKRRTDLKSHDRNCAKRSDRLRYGLNDGKEGMSIKDRIRSVSFLPWRRRSRRNRRDRSDRALETGSLPAMAATSMATQEEPDVSNDDAVPQSIAYEKPKESLISSKAADDEGGRRGDHDSHSHHSKKSSHSRTARRKKTRSKTNQQILYVWLLSPEHKVFEVVKVNYKEESTIGEILTLARDAAVDPILSDQRYVSLCNDELELVQAELPVRYIFTEEYKPLSPAQRDGNYAASSGSSVSSELSHRHDHCTLLAVPDGSTAVVVRHIRHALCENPRIQRWLEKQDLFRPKRRRRPSMSSVASGAETSTSAAPPMAEITMDT